MATGGTSLNTVLDRPLVFVDIETNGLNHIRGRVIEVAAIRVEQGRITRVFNQLVDPETELPFFITNLTGIRTEDLHGAAPFRSIAHELHDILSGAIFVAHNVRFDYSFLKQEFKRVGQEFLPKQLCTVKLSRTLYPEQKSHKLESLIARHGFSFEKRHRAYDDALVLWQFLQHVQAYFPADVLQAAVAKQLKQPALPKGLASELVKDLPELPGVYIFEDEQHKPLYIGKSINIKKRVLSHFGHDHDNSKEFKIAQTIKHISTKTTAGELEALLLESRLVKDMMPLYNRQLRKTQKLLIARQTLDEHGYINVSLEEASQLTAQDLSNVLAVYARRSAARSSLADIQKLYELCPKLLGLEKSRGACFLRQLHKCRGACTAAEPPELYNRRVRLAYERQRIQDWPYSGAVLVQEKCNERSSLSSGIIVDQWCVLAEINQDEYCEPTIHHSLSSGGRSFDLDTYKILQSFLAAKIHKLIIQPLSSQQLQQFGI
jgi:DNA polymerase-3 subunit epsilon